MGFVSVEALCCPFEKKCILQQYNAESFQTLLEEIIDRSNPDLDTKSMAESIRYRKQGNRLFAKVNHSGSQHKEIWKLYTQSIATAPIDSEELASGYSNRSALLAHMGKYKESCQDIISALRIITNRILKMKLLCRQIKCLVAINDDHVQLVWEKARALLHKRESEEENKELKILLQKAHHVLESNNIKCPVKNLMQKKYGIWHSGTSGIDINYNQEGNWELKALRDLSPGNIICAQRVQMTTISCQMAFFYCHYCFLFLGPVPCKSCSLTIYCSEICRESAWNMYHDIECFIFPLMVFDNSLCYYSRLGLQATISCIKKAGSVARLKNEFEAMEELSGIISLKKPHKL